MTNAQQLPRITVVTPSLNQDAFLETCIRSVLEQDYPNLEYFVLDGGSNDRSTEVIRQFESQIDYWISQPDNGQSDAINRGFRMATGDLLAWLNSDDYYLPGTLHRVAAIYQKNSNASFYFGDGLRVDRCGNTISPFFPTGDILFNKQALVMGLNYVLQPASFINRKFVNLQQVLDPELRYGMDTDLWLRLASVASPECVPAILAASREYGETKTASGSFARCEELRQIGEQHSDLPMTPGAMCYFLDTLHRYCRERHDVFPQTVVEQIEQLWAATSVAFDAFGARPDGFPLRKTA